MVNLLEEPDVSSKMFENSNFTTDLTIEKNYRNFTSVFDIASLSYILLNILCTCFRGEYSKTVVPEAAGHQEPAIHCGNEAIASYFQFLTEIITQVSFERLIRVIGRLGCP